ncbi:SDR family NAD(P)-dependent oxidoreductase [Halonatronum saccharophilum]|uniref:SDR family NAD(P)-dependent oxidoreductase n=1 Tax=Halonatronum saccharophilum TaxID=150060 RepID=UPI00048A000F|nr:SDR family NAD(P)-dependent oxidoreductase [Halonatronum saccharophilum]
MKKAIVIGASSGIGKELAKVLSQSNYIVGLVARRRKLLKELQQELSGKSFVKSFDVSLMNNCMHHLEDLIEEMNGVDLIIISAGCGFINPDLEYEKEKKTIDVNVLGFSAMINVAYNYFFKKGKGHIVGISSIAAIRGGYDAPAYYASKAFISNYMEGLRIKAKKAKVPLYITDIKAGFVDTAMAQGEGLFWVASPEKAALQIYKTITNKKDHAYITKRWRLIAWLLKVIPNCIYQRL